MVYFYFDLLRNFGVYFTLLHILSIYFTLIYFGNYMFYFGLHLEFGWYNLSKSDTDSLRDIANLFSKILANTFLTTRSTHAVGMYIQERLSARRGVVSYRERS